MPLPIVHLRHSKFQFHDGQIVEFRELSRAEALEVGMIGADPKLIEATVIAYATNTPLEEVIPWMDATSQEDVRRLFDAIREASGLLEETGKDSGEDLPSEKSTDSTISSPKT